MSRRAGAVTACGLALACAGDTTDSSDTPADTAECPTWFVDYDADGYGDPSKGVETCEPTPDQVENSTDCDDKDASINPGSEERCDDVDQDCDGAVDEDAVDAAAWLADGDGDGWGADDNVTWACARPTGTTTTGGDCDDGDPDAHPGASDMCGDGVDSDCDGGDPICRLDGEYDLETSARAVLRGELGGDGAGVAIVLGEDLTGDGQIDIVVFASEQFTEDLGTRPEMLGRAYVVDGLVAGTHDLPDVASAEVAGTSAQEITYGVVGLVPDVTDDGQADMLVSANSYNTVYLFEGPFDGALDLEDADLTLSGPPGGRLARSFAALGAADGSMAPSLALGGPNSSVYDESWYDNVGYVLIFDAPLGGSSGADSAAASVSLDPPSYFEHARLGAAMCSGDVDGDGVLDLHASVLGSLTSYMPSGLTAGAVYRVLGPLEGGVVAETEGGGLDGAIARFDGEFSGDAAGGSLSCSGDVDGDGRADLVVGALASGDDTSSYVSAGSAYLVLGTPSGLIPLGESDWRVDGAEDGDLVGESVSIESDLDGDGLHDIVVGSSIDWRGTGYPGAAMVFYGTPTGTAAPSDAEAVLLPHGDYNHGVVSIAGGSDLNGDGFEDLVIGGGDPTNGQWAGAAYVVLGGDGT